MEFFGNSKYGTVGIPQEAMDILEEVTNSHYIKRFGFKSLGDVGNGNLSSTKKSDYDHSSDVQICLQQAASKLPESWKFGTD